MPTTSTSTRQHRFWTTTDVAKLRRLYTAGLTERAIAEVLGRTLGSVASRLHLLRAKGELITRRRTHQPWTTADIRTAKALAEDGLTAKTIGAQLARDPENVRRQLAHYQVKPGKDTSSRPTGPGSRYGDAKTTLGDPANGQGWTDTEDRTLLRRYRARVPIKLIARELGRTASATNGRLHRLRAAGPAKMPGQRHRRWTENDDAKLKAGVEKEILYSVLAKRLKRTVSAVINRAHCKGWTAHPAAPKGTPEPVNDNETVRRERRPYPAGANPARQLSLQPEAIGATEGGNDPG